MSLYHSLHAVIVARESLSRSAFVRSHCGLDIAKQVFQVHGVNKHGAVKARKTPAVRDGVGVGPTGELMATQYVAGLPRAGQERPPTTRAYKLLEARQEHARNEPA